MTEFLKIWFPAEATDIETINDTTSTLIRYKIDNLIQNDVTYRQIKYVGSTHCTNQNNKNFGKILAHFVVLGEGYDILSHF